MHKNEIIMTINNCSKRFPGVLALNNVRLDIRKGEVHALMGENGAGKSTIMKIIAGIYNPDEGEIFLNGKKTNFKSPKHALECGISMIHQELNLIPEMTIEENLFIGREETYKLLGIVKKKELIEKARKLFDELEINIDPKSKVSSLSVAEMQMVEIIKATSYNAEILIMDEPTSAITDREVEKLFNIINSLKSKGKAIIYISHKMDEIFKIADRITVLRDGCYVDSMEIDKIDNEKLISLMVGRELKDVFVKGNKSIKEENSISVKNLSRIGEFQDISFNVKKGEILGLAGLMGAGRTEIVETIFGLRKCDSGEILINDKKVSINNPKDAIKHKVALISEDRKLYGLNLKGNIKNNISITYIDKFTNALQIVDEKDETNSAKDQMRNLRIKAINENVITGTLSGGNQQKVVIAKWLLGNPDIIILDEPTRGIDIGAKSEIYKIMTEIVQKGKSIIMISSEMPELIGMSDRVIVLHEGKITGEFYREEFNQEDLMTCATGHIKRGLYNECSRNKDKVKKYKKKFSI